MVRRRREPEFPLSRAALVQKCQEDGNDLLNAGVGLALMDLMTEFHCNILTLNRLSGVARSMISDMLAMKTVATPNTVGKLARVFRLKTMELYLLGQFALRAEVPPWRHRQIPGEEEHCAHESAAPPLPRPPGPPDGSPSPAQGTPEPEKLPPFPEKEGTFFHQGSPFSRKGEPFFREGLPSS